MRDLPCPLPGHWNASDGHEMALRYAPKTREQLAGGISTDMLVAFEIASLCRDDHDFEAVLSTAKDRIRWLSVQLALAQMEAKTLVTPEASAAWAAEIARGMQLRRNDNEHPEAFALGWERAMLAIVRTFEALAAQAVQQ